MTKAVPKSLPRPFWLTRDVDPLTGLLDDTVDVWSIRPIRLRDGIWIIDPYLLQEHHVGRISAAAALVRFRTIPETELECIHYEACP